MSYPHESTLRSQMSGKTMARALGWFSIGLGLAELFAPRRVARMSGLRGQEDLLRAYGLREVLTGVGILAADDPEPWIWGRVGGDALDLATLGAAGRAHPGRARNVALALAAVAGVTALDLMCVRQLAVERRQARSGLWDYSDRSGLPRPPSEMRGAASDFVVPADMRSMPAPASEMRH